MSLPIQPGEQWRPIPGSPGYEVSDLGRVVSYRRTRPVILKPWVTPKGYHFVRLWSTALDSSPLAVHRLVMRTFIGAPPEGLEVRHLDGNADNNALSNLAYGTHLENVQDSIRHGTHPNGGKTHCVRGHLFDEVNTGRGSQGERRCRTCKRVQNAESKRRAKERNQDGTTHPPRDHAPAKEGRELGL